MLKRVDCHRRPRVIKVSPVDGIKTAARGEVDGDTAGRPPSPIQAERVKDGTGPDDGGLPVAPDPRGQSSATEEPK